MLEVLLVYGEVLVVTRGITWVWGSAGWTRGITCVWEKRSLC